MNAIWYVVFVILILAVLGGGGYGIYLLVQKLEHPSADPGTGDAAINGLWQLSAGGSCTNLCLVNGEATVPAQAGTVRIAVASTGHGTISVTSTPSSGAAQTLTGTIDAAGSTITLADGSTLTKTASTCTASQSGPASSCTGAPSTPTAPTTV